MKTWLEFQAMRAQTRERRKRYYRERRERLLKKLGAVCVNCGCTRLELLEFDHITPATWDRANTGSRKRLRLYEREAAQGLLQVLCRSCNAAKAKRESVQLRLELELELEEPSNTETTSEPF